MRRPGQGRYVVAGAAVAGDLLATFGCSRELWPAVTAWVRRAYGYRVFAKCKERVARSDHVVVFLCTPYPVVGCCVLGPDWKGNQQVWNGEVSTGLGHPTHSVVGSSPKPKLIPPRSLPIPCLLSLVSVPLFAQVPGGLHAALSLVGIVLARCPGYRGGEKGPQGSGTETV